MIVWYGGSPTNSASFFSMISCNENEPAVTVHGYWYLLSESNKDRKKRKRLCSLGLRLSCPTWNSYPQLSSDACMTLHPRFNHQKELHYLKTIKQYRKPTNRKYMEFGTWSKNQQSDREIMFLFYMLLVCSPLSRMHTWDILSRITCLTTIHFYT